MTACCQCVTHIIVTCHRYFEDVSASDVRAILSNHARMEDIEVSVLAAALAAHTGGEDTAPEGSLTAPSPAKAHAAPLSPDMCAGPPPGRTAGCNVLAGALTSYPSSGMSFH